jgi:hypothetical protein
MREFPVMMYLHDGSLAYKVVHSAAEAKEYEEKGYNYDRWGVKPKEEPLPKTEEPKKKAFPKWRCDFCGKHLKRFDHSKCGVQNAA